MTSLRPPVIRQVARKRQIFHLLKGEERLATYGPWLILPMICGRSWLAYELEWQEAIDWDLTDARLCRTCARKERIRAEKAVRFATS